MSILNKINKLRMTLLRRIAANIGVSRAKKNTNPNNKIEVNKVLISRPNNRLGNLLLITPLVEEIMRTFPNSKIDLFVKGGVATELFKNYSAIDKIIQLPKKPFKNLIKYIFIWISIREKYYDLVINVVNYSSSGRLSTQFARSKYKFFGESGNDLNLKYNDHQHIAKNPVYSFRSYLSEMGYVENNEKIPLLNLRLSDSEMAKGRDLLCKLVQNDKATICLFTYATGDKRYSESWWAIFYEKLKLKYPEYNIIEVLPVENVSQIEFNAPSFYSKDIRELGSVIANTNVFIGADSGIMHLASAVQIPTVGLFSRDNIKTYEPYDNGSIAVNTNEGNVDEWIKIIDKVINENASKRKCIVRELFPYHGECM